MMRRAMMLAGLCGLVAASAVRAQEVIAARDLSALGYDAFWSTSVEQRRGSAVQATYLRDDTLYIVTQDGTVHAVHAAAGLSRWSQALVSGVYQIFPPTHFVDERDRALVVFTTTPRVTLIDRYSGDIVAEVPNEHAPAGSAVGSESIVFFGSSDGHFYAETWDHPQLNRAVQFWRVRTDGEIRSTPALVNESRDLIFASQNGTIYNCTTIGKRLNWKYRTDGDMIADLTVDESGVYVAGGDRSLYRLEIGSGEAKWRVRFPEPLIDSPLVNGRVVYQYCPGEGVVALDVDSGELVWRNIDGRQVVAVGVDFAFCRGADGRLLKVDGKSGETVASALVPNETLVVVNARDDALYFVNRRGAIICARPAGSARLSPAEMAKARQQLHVAPSEPAAEAEPSPTPQPAEEGVDLKDPLRSRGDKPRKEGDGGS